ncbi:hypothetical protein GSI_09081 [Ganoderma sinense ZZ0214-1]|uniref:Uncharacterized protein n=1 Tax=Ganoderma sinense ZZ0214-1 TaxID=1077348 RepID=A0A2G8S5I8_9APHY|nr:hypothetical protein GSI_09081 [Ganoderma sinense ZZ0214-1]
MLLATFNRVFRPVTASFDSERSREFDPLSGLSVRPRLCERDEDDASSDGDRNINIGDLCLSVDSDDAPLLARRHSPQPSTSTTTTVTVTASGEILHAGPSHVYWKTPHLDSGIVLGSQRPSSRAGPASSNSVDYASIHSHTPTSPVLWGYHSISRLRKYKPSSLGRQSLRSLRLPRDSFSASEDSDAESAHSLRDEQPALPKQLSPIHEQQVPFPPHRKLSVDSVRTPDSTRTFDRITTHSTHSAFINRPLKRSISQTSTSTHLSAMSAPTPPLIPPLDLRPNFQATMGSVPSQGRQSPIVLQLPTPRKSRLPTPTLPTVIGSPRQTNMVSVIYEDGASASASARSSAGSADTSGTASTARPAGLCDPASPQSRSDADGEPDTRPNSLSLSRIVPRPQNPVPPSTHSRLETPRNSDSGVLLRPLPPSPDWLSADGPEAPFLAHSDSGGQRSELRLKGTTSFGSAPFVHPPPADAQRERATHACVLFWAGFVAPWCWLIGGWLLSREGEPEGHGPILPLWHRHRHLSRRRGAGRGTHVPVDRGDGCEYGELDHQQHARGVPCGDGGGAHEFRGSGTASEKRAKAMTSWYPLFAPSVESLAPSTRSLSSAHKLRILHDHGARGVDPWIARCRVAAGVSGVFIFAGFVVAMVFAARVHA